MSYLKTVFGVTAFLVVTVACINFFANPIDIYNPPLIKGINGVYPAAVVYARLEKAEAVKRLKPDVIITGSSRADIGLDPRAEFFPGMTAYNYGLSAPTIYEQRRALEFAEMVHPLKKAIITLDFFCFNAHKLENKQFEPERLTPEALSQPRAFFNGYGTIFALDTLIASIKNLRYIRHLERYAYSEPDGHKINNDIAYDISINGTIHMFKHPPSEKETAVDDFSFSYSDKPGDDVFRHLEAMLDLMRQNKVDVIVLLSPTHEWYIRGLEAQGKAGLVDEWKKRITEIVRSNAARYSEKPYPLWDFDYRNSLTTEPVPAGKKNQMKWWWDPSHYKTETGDIVLRKILGLPGAEKYPDFGRKL